MSTLLSPAESPPARGSLLRDLLECGIPFAQVRAVEERYARALASGSPADWIELYIGVFATLARWMHRTQAARLPAARGVLLLLNDDLGSKLFDADARADLARELHASVA